MKICAMKRTTHKRVGENLKALNKDHLTEITHNIKFDIIPGYRANNETHSRLSKAVLVVNQRQPT
jgi:hypothetical protein